MNNQQTELPWDDGFTWVPDELKLFNEKNFTSFNSMEELVRHLYFVDERTKLDGHRVATLLGETSYWFYKKAKEYDIDLCYTPRQARKMLLFFGIPKNLRHKLKVTDISYITGCSEPYIELLSKLKKDIHKSDQLKYIKTTCPKDFINEAL